MIGYADGQTTILCDEILTEDGHTPVGCDQQAVMLVVSDGVDGTLEAWAWCVDHAPEAAHEAASSMSADEFVIVTLTAGGAS